MGSLETCNQCNQCLEEKTPEPKQRLKLCPKCRDCSLDCSHFTQMVYARVGFGHPYLTTSQMLGKSSVELEKKYGLIVIGTDANLARAGDLLVYTGHVVILEKSYKEKSNHVFGDVVHATGGKDLKGPGTGIQRERHARLSTFRGDLRRILRHKKMQVLLGEYSHNSGETMRLNQGKLRKIDKRDP